MKLYHILGILLLLGCITYGVVSCERDDICAEDTPITPQLIIKFFNRDLPDQIKRPNELAVKAIGFDSIIRFETNQDSILIPLRTDAAFTDFEITIDADTTNAGSPPNIDTLKLQYTPQEEYVSSACGFRVVYLGTTAGVVSELNDGDDDTLNWIDRIELREENIKRENEAHLFIFH